MVLLNTKTLKGYTLAILSAVIYGCMPLMAKHIYADGINPLTLVFLRNLLALPSLAILALLEKKTLKIPLKSIPIISLISLFGCSLTPVLLFCSYNYIATGTATVLHFIYPSLVVIISVIFLKKRPSILTIISVFLCFAGICFFYDPSTNFNLNGAFFALSSGLAMAIYVTLLSLFKNKQVSGFLFSFYIAAISSIIMFIVCIAANSLALPQNLVSWGMCLLFAILVTTLAVVFFQQSAFIIGGEKTSILSAIEPITSVIVGIIFFNEPIIFKILIGIILVIAASILIAVSDIKSKMR